MSLIVPKKIRIPMSPKQEAKLLLAVVSLTAAAWLFTYLMFCF